MSTRATYEFGDLHNYHTVYKHHDGYPEGALQHINAAVSYAWPLPRFEASEFAAAFVTANKVGGGGGVYLTQDRDAHSDTEYHYVVGCNEGILSVTCYHRGSSTLELIERWEGWDMKFTGKLEELMAVYCNV
jgi:hypothetical protein